MSKQPNWHNPNGVTQKELGKGWRFLTVEEQACRAGSPITRDIDMWVGSEWDRGWTGNSLHATYRTQQPLGYLLPKKPKPKRKVESANRAYMHAYNKSSGTDYKDAIACAAHTGRTLAIFNAGRRYERRRLRAGGGA